jgi:signal transduction histidine kinase
MFTEANLVKRLRVMTMIRLFIAAIFLFYAQSVFPLEAVVFYILIAVIAVLSIAYVVWLSVEVKLRLLAYLQIVGDLLLESALVYYTGGADSLFAAVYVVSILSTGFVLSSISSLVVATISSLLFISMVFANYLGISPRDFTMSHATFLVRQDAVYLFYATYVRIAMFYIVAFLTYYFSGRIQSLESRVKTQERLAFLGEVISTIAHEIRNPLASISGAVELISKQVDGKLSPTQKKLMNAAVDESARIKHIFNGLLDYARVPVLNREIVQLDTFLEDVFLLMEHQDGYNAQVRICRRYEGKKLKALIDPEHMKRAVMNVLVNAYQAMPSGGRLDVDCVLRRGEIQISFEDTGQGMNQKEMEVLFIPFRTSKRDGTGLGMAEAYKVVNQHGGRILVQSKKKKGTRVDVRIPKNAA